MKEGASTDAERGPWDGMGAELYDPKAIWLHSAFQWDDWLPPPRQNRLQTSQEKLYAHNPSTWEVEADQFKVSSAM